MKVLRSVAGFLIAVSLAPPAWAQAPPTARRAVAKPDQVIIVRDVSGAPIEGVHVTISGPGRAEGTTDKQGIMSVQLAAGSYRARFEHETFITLERDLTIRTVQKGAEIAVALNRAPAKPEPPPPAPAPVPPPPPAVAVGPPVSISIPEFLEKTYVGRDPMKESILSCMPDATARLLQVNNPMAVHTHTDLDEVLYVVAGDGTVRIGHNLIAIAPGSMLAIPRGTPHSIERRGRNPLIMLSTQAGAPCPQTSTGGGSPQNR